MSLGSYIFVGCHRNSENRGVGLHKYHGIIVYCLMPLFSFIGGGNRSTRRKPQTWRKSLANFIT